MVLNCQRKERGALGLPSMLKEGTEWLKCGYHNGDDYCDGNDNYDNSDHENANHAGDYDGERKG